MGAVKPLPAPDVPGHTEAERMDNAVRRSFSVTKEEIEQREKEWQQNRKRKKAAKR